jgi:branched-chain amino acid transport system ATP-binding protein
MVEPVLEIRNLAKSFGALKATMARASTFARRNPRPDRPERGGQEHAHPPDRRRARTRCRQIRFLGTDVGPRYGAARAAGPCPHLPDLLTRAGVFRASQRHACGAGAAGNELPLLPLRWQATSLSSIRQWPCCRASGWRAAQACPAAALSHGERRQLEIADGTRPWAQSLPARRADGRHGAGRLESS